MSSNDVSVQVIVNKFRKATRRNKNQKRLRNLKNVHILMELLRPKRDVDKSDLPLSIILVSLTEWISKTQSRCPSLSHLSKSSLCPAGVSVADKIRKFAECSSAGFKAGLYLESLNPNQNPYFSSLETN